MAVTRTTKLNAEFQREIYRILTTKVKDPRLTEMFTITEVSCDKDLTLAKVFVSIYSTDEVKASQTMEAITNSANFIRQHIGKEMHIRTVPQFVFVEDNASKSNDKINNILKTLKKDD